jgi:hypothetical protein
MPETLDGDGYRLVLERALKRIRKFNPQFLVLAKNDDNVSGLRGAK